MKVRERLSERGFKLVLTDSAKELIITKSCKELDFGARPLRRAIEQRIEDPLLEDLLKGEFQGMDTIVVDGVVDDEGKIRRLILRGEIRDEPVEEEPAPAEAVGAAEGADEGSAGWRVLGPLTTIPKMHKTHGPHPWVFFCRALSGSQTPAWEPLSPKLCFGRVEAELPKSAFPSRSLGTRGSLSKNPCSIRGYYLWPKAATDAVTGRLS